MPKVEDIKRSSEGIVSPKSIMLPYQRRWAEDGARFKIGLMARQTGKDFSSAEEAVEDALQTPKTQWTILATGERQALESVGQAKMWAEAYKVQIQDYVEDREGAETLIKSAEIIFGNGSRLRALPANPATARGLSTNLILTEFAFHEKPDQIWRAIYPSISNPMRGGEKKLRIISTPNGRGNKFADLWHKNYQAGKNGLNGLNGRDGRDGRDGLNGRDGQRGAVYSCHKVTIHDAVKDGLPVNVEELRAGLDDAEGWAQEYECEFLDAANILLPYEVIALCENPMASETVGADYWTVAQKEPLYCGIDFGRKRDLTVCWTVKAIGAYLLTVEVLVLEKTSTPEQVRILSPRVKAARRTCLDYTGAGVGLGDYLVEKFGEYNPEKHQGGKVELCQFTGAFKAELFPRLRSEFDNKHLGIPISRSIREDLHSIYRIASPNGNVTYRAPHTDDGHADRATALALVNRAADCGGGPFQYQAIALPGRIRRGKGVLA